MARVLVVDDAAFMRKMVGDALVSGGHEVIGEAGNGTEAVERFVALKPFVVKPFQADRVIEAVGKALT